jgi:hypothetical protein
MLNRGYLLNFLRIVEELVVAIDAAGTGFKSGRVGCMALGGSLSAELQFRPSVRLCVFLIVRFLVFIVNMFGWWLFITVTALSLGLGVCP